MAILFLAHPYIESATALSDSLIINQKCNTVTLKEYSNHAQHKMSDYCTCMACKLMLDGDEHHSPNSLSAHFDCPL